MAAIPPVCDFGLPAPGFELMGTDGSRHRLEDLAGPSGTVIVFMCNHCPYVQVMLPSLIEDARTLRGFGVSVVGINANDEKAYPEDSFSGMVELIRRLELGFPYLHDADQSVARAYGAVCTPDFFGYNSAMELQYRGRLDAAGKAGKPGTRRDLVLAMRDVALTGRGPAEQTASIGCSIKWREGA